MRGPAVLGHQLHDSRHFAESFPTAWTGSFDPMQSLALLKLPTET